MVAHSNAVQKVSKNAFDLPNYNSPAVTMSVQEDNVQPDLSGPPATAAAGPSAIPTAAAPSLMPLTMPYYFGAPWFPRYSGEVHTLRDFKEKILAVFRLYPVSSEQQMEILLAQLEGAALREVKSWPSSERRTMEQIFERLYTTFEPRTVSEVKMRFFSKKQQSGESLRDFALSLQETLRAVVQIDPREAENQDKTLKEQFIEGVNTDNLKSQLRMLAAQHPRATFLDFKELAISILGKSPPTEPVRSVEVPVSQLVTPVKSLPIVSQATQAPIPDAVAALTEQVHFLTKSLEEVRQKLEQWEKPLMLEDEKPVSRRLLPSDYRETYSRKSGGRPPDRTSTPKRPICTYCHKPGHTEATCWQLNGKPPRPRTTPREVNQ